MAKMVKPTNTIGLTLLHKCNSKCPHCGYLWVGDTDDHVIKPGYKLTWEQIQTFISDCSGIEDKTFSVVINGGEPSLWEEGDRNFIDVALAIAEGGIHPTFNTNGSYFVDYDQCYNFFHRYAEESKLPLMTYVSIDKFHYNYDRERGRADSLDNIKKVLDEMPDSSDLFKNGPPPGDVGTLVGEYYRRGDKDVAKLGHLKALLSEDAGLQKTT